MKLLARWKEYLVLVIVIAAVYGQTIGFDFINYDDHDLVYGNEEYLSNLSNVFTSFKTHVFSLRKSSTVPYYRPLLLVSYIFEYHLWSLSPVGFHCFNILIHMLVTFLVFRFLVLLSGDKISSLLLSLLFAVHPVQTETVAWISGLNDLLLALFILFMTISYIRYRQSQDTQQQYFTATIIFFILAIFTKESAVFYSLLLPAYDLCTHHSPIQLVRSKKYWIKFIPLGAIVLVYIIIRQLVFGVFIGAGKLYDITPLAERLIRLPATIATHIWFIIFPSNLSITHQTNDIFWFHQPWLSLALIFPIVIVLAIWKTWSTDRIMSFGLLWFLIGLLPVLNLIPLPVPILEHRLYIPMAGLLLATSRVLSLQSILHLSSSIKRTVVVAIICACAVGSFFRLPVWRNSETIWKDAILKSPTSLLAHKNLAAYYFDSGGYDNAIYWMKKELQLFPEDKFILTKLRIAYVLVGNNDSAETVCRRLIAIEPTNSNRYLDLGLLFAKLNKFDSAIVYYNRGLQFDSNSYMLQHYLGEAYDHQGNLTYAEDHYLRSTEINPRYSLPYFALGNLYARAGLTDAAISNLEEGMKAGTPPMESVQLLILLYTQTGRTTEASDLARRFGL